MLRIDPDEVEPGEACGMHHRRRHACDDAPCDQPVGRHLPAKLVGIELDWTMHVLLPLIEGTAEDDLRSDPCRNSLDPNVVPQGLETLLTAEAAVFRPAEG